MVQEALGAGARGYVVKTDAGKELLKALHAVLRGEQFIGKSFSGHDFSRTRETASIDVPDDTTYTPLQEVARSFTHTNFVSILARSVRWQFGQFTGAGTHNADNGVVGVVTELPKRSILRRLHVLGRLLALPPARIDA